MAAQGQPDFITVAAAEEMLQRLVNAQVTTLTQQQQHIQALNEETRSFIEQFGVDKQEYDPGIARGHRSSDGRPIVKIGGVGKFTTADATDYAAGKPYVRKRHLETSSHEVWCRQTRQ